RRIPCCATSIANLIAPVSPSAYIGSLLRLDVLQNLGEQDRVVRSESPREHRPRLPQGEVTQLVLLGRLHLRFPELVGGPGLPVLQLPSSDFRAPVAVRAVEHGPAAHVVTRVRTLDAVAATHDGRLHLEYALLSVVVDPQGAQPTADQLPLADV